MHDSEDKKFKTLYITPGYKGESAKLYAKNDENAISPAKKLMFNISPRRNESVNV